MGEDLQEKVPKVFISYSHDSPQHKNWVAELAAKLVDKGIDVALDRWDLRRGGEVPKYMENSVGWADRVLMICTETYVRKADEGKDGVGYEAMIVTSELISDLGTTKFIPIIRQSEGKAKVPKSMGTRFYVNLSEGQKFDEEFEELLRELHDEPALKKPPIGKNPFAQTSGGKELAVAEAAVTAPSPPVVPASTNVEAGAIIIPEPNYQNALSIARAGDVLIWRRLIQRAKVIIPERLAEWRKRWEKPVLKNEEAIPACLDGIQAYDSLISVALAGVESGRDAMKNQIGIMDDILSLKNWNRGGYVMLGEFPAAAAFSYQALHGALCLETQQLDLAMSLAKARIQDPDNSSHREPLYHQNKLIGWPESLHGHAKIAWQYLRDLPKSLPWLNEIFTDKENFEVALCAYYLALNTLELADLIASNKEKILTHRELRLEVPLSATFVSHEQRQRAYALLMRDPRQVRKIWEDLEVPEAKMREHWPQWMLHAGGWVSQVSQFGYRGEIPHKTLFDDLPKKRD